MKKRKSKKRSEFLSDLLILTISPDKIEHVSQSLPELIWIKNHPTPNIYIHCIEIKYA